MHEESLYFSVMISWMVPWLCQLQHFRAQIAWSESAWELYRWISENCCGSESLSQKHEWPTRRDRSQLRDKESRIEYGWMSVTKKRDVEKQYLNKMPRWLICINTFCIKENSVLTATSLKLFSGTVLKIPFNSGSYFTLISDNEGGITGALGFWRMCNTQ